MRLDLGGHPLLPKVGEAGGGAGIPGAGEGCRVGVKKSQEPKWRVDQSQEKEWLDQSESQEEADKS